MWFYSKYDVLVYKNEYTYCCWPHGVVLRNGDLVVAFCEGIRRPKIVHQDPTFYNVLVRSRDQGETWSRFSRTIPNYDFYGMSGPALTELSNGDLLMNAMRNLFVPLETAGKVLRYKDFNRIKPYPWSRRRGGTYVHRSKDGGYTWLESVKVDISPFIHGIAARPMVELGDDTLVLACSGVREHSSFEPAAAFLVRSTDGGRIWGETTIIAKDKRVEFNEPSLLLLSNGKIIAVLSTGRTGGQYLYQCESNDDGRTWTMPRRTPIWGHPAHLLRLKDGRILCSYGYRRPPYGIRACLISDDGKTWDIKNELVIRDDFLNTDLGYPTSMQLDDETIFTVYYGRNQAVTCIQGSSYRI